MYSIIGSGIAGLACSCVLSNYDIKNEIFESGDQRIANQYGIQLSPNASNVLQKMGILKKLESHIKVINNIEIYSTEKLKKLTTLPVNKFINKNNLTNYYTASRDILHKELLSNVIASKTMINYDSKIKKVEDLGDKIQIIRENKTISSCKNLIIANGNSSSPIFDRISCSPIANDFMTYRSAVKVHKSPIKISTDTIYLFLLASVCTAYAFIASVYVMRYISPYTVVLTYNFEPIYGILLAVIFFPENEIMSPLFYLGTGLIISTVLGNALLKYKMGKN